MAGASEAIRAAQLILQAQFPALAVDGQWGRDSQRAFEAASHSMRVDVIKTFADYGHSLNDVQRAAQRGDGLTRHQPPPQSVKATPVAQQKKEYGMLDKASLFNNEVVPAVKAEAARRGVNALFHVAQLALESGYGLRVPLTKDGQLSYNYGGLKTNVMRGWSGAYGSVANTTTEYAGGKPKVIVDGFASFRSPAEFVQAYFWYLFDGPSSYRYKDGIKSAQTADEYGAALQKRGYATDPRYAAKVASAAREVSGKYDLA